PTTLGVGFGLKRVPGIEAYVLIPRLGINPARVIRHFGKGDRREALGALRRLSLADLLDCLRGLAAAVIALPEAGRDALLHLLCQEFKNLTEAYFVKHRLV